MGTCKKRHRIWIGTIAMVVVCLFTVNTVSWAYPDVTSPLYEETLQAQLLSKPILKVIGWEYDRQLKVELACILSLAATGQYRSYLDINTEITKWLCAAPEIDDKRSQRILEVTGEPEINQDETVIEIELINDPRKKFRIHQPLEGNAWVEKMEAGKNKEARTPEAKAPPAETKTGAEDPFPWMISGTEVDTGDIIGIFNDKYLQRLIFRGSAVKQPGFFIMCNNPHGYALPFVDVSSGRDFALIMKDLLRGHLSLPAVFKLNGAALGEGMFFIEKEREGEIVLTLSGTRFGRKEVKDILKEFPGIEVRQDEEEDILQVAIDTEASDPISATTRLYKYLATPQDMGMVEAVMPVAKYAGKTCETRFFFRGNLADEDCELAKNKSDRTAFSGWFSKIGSSGYFANQSGRLEARKLYGAEIYGPLFELFDMPVNLREDFIKYIDDSIKELYRHAVRRLKASGIEADIDVAGYFDLMWTMPEEGEFPVPALIESAMCRSDQAETDRKFTVQKNISRIGKKMRVVSVDADPEGKPIKAVARDPEGADHDLTLDRQGELKPDRLRSYFEDLSNIEEGHLRLIFNILDQLKEAPPELYAFSDKFNDNTSAGDLFGFPSKEHNMIAIRRDLLTHSIALFHEICEYLIGKKLMDISIEDDVLIISIGDSVVRVDAAQAIRQLRRENESWAEWWKQEVLNHPKNRHYLIRILQKAIFGDRDRRLTSKIRDSQMERSLVDIGSIRRDSTRLSVKPFEPEVKRSPLDTVALEGLFKTGLMMIGNQFYFGVRPALKAYPDVGIKLNMEKKIRKSDLLAIPDNITWEDIERVQQIFYHISELKLRAKKAEETQGNYSKLLREQAEEARKEVNAELKKLGIDFELMDYDESDTRVVLKPEAAVIAERRAAQFIAKENLAKMEQHIRGLKTGRVTPVLTEEGNIKILVLADKGGRLVKDKEVLTADKAELLYIPDEDKLMLVSDAHEYVKKTISLYNEKHSYKGGQVGKKARVLYVDKKKEKAVIKDSGGRTHIPFIFDSGKSWLEVAGIKIRRNEDITDEHKEYLQSILSLFEKSPPRLFVYDDLVEDLFGFAYPERGMITLHRALEHDPVALFHEASEYLVKKEKITYKFNGWLASRLKGTFWLNILNRLGLLSGKIIARREDTGEIIGSIKIKKDALSIALKDTNSSHYLARAAQRQAFGEEDRGLASKIKFYQDVNRKVGLQNYLGARKKGYEFLGLDRYRDFSERLRDMTGAGFLAINKTKRAGVYDPLAEQGQGLRFARVVAGEIPDICQKMRNRKKDDMRILVIGTGSGLDAMTAFCQARKKIKNVHVDAIDINPLAVENTELNLRLSGSSYEKGIHPMLVEEGKEFARLTHAYDLIIFNAPNACRKTDGSKIEGGNITMDTGIFNNLMREAEAHLSPDGAAIVDMRDDIERSARNFIPRGMRAHPLDVFKRQDIDESWRATYKLEREKPRIGKKANVAGLDLQRGIAGVRNSKGELKSVGLDPKGRFDVKDFASLIKSMEELDYGHRTLMLNMLYLFQKSPPDYYEFDELVEDFMGFASPKHNMFALHSFLTKKITSPFVSTPATMHELGEYLIASGAVRIKYKGSFAVILNKLGLGKIFDKLGLFRGKLIVTDSAGNTLGVVRVRGEALSIALKDRKDPHYLLRAFQRQAFKTMDIALAKEIKIAQRLQEAGISFSEYGRINKDGYTLLGIEVGYKDKIDISDALEELTGRKYLAWRHPVYSPTNDDQIAIHFGKAVAGEIKDIAARIKLKGKEKMRVLEIGTGTGFLSQTVFHHARLNGIHKVAIDAIDISRDAVETAMYNLDLAGGECRSSIQPMLVEEGNEFAELPYFYDLIIFNAPNASYIAQGEEPANKSTHMDERAFRHIMQEVAMHLTHGGIALIENVKGVNASDRGLVPEGLSISSPDVYNGYVLGNVERLITRYVRSDETEEMPIGKEDRKFAELLSYMYGEIDKMYAEAIPYALGPEEIENVTKVCRTAKERVFSIVDETRKMPEEGAFDRFMNKIFGFDPLTSAKDRCGVTLEIYRDAFRRFIINHRARREEILKDAGKTIDSINRMAVKRPVRRIVVAEDLPRILEDYRKFFAQLGNDRLEVIYFDNGKKAWEFLKKNYGEIDLLITDLDMPGMNGAALVKSVRKRFGIDMPALFVTGAKLSGSMLKELGNATQLHKTRFCAEAFHGVVRAFISAGERSESLPPMGGGYDNVKLTELARDPGTTSQQLVSYIEEFGLDSAAGVIREALSDQPEKLAEFEKSLGGKKGGETSPSSSSPAAGTFAERKEAEECRRIMRRAREEVREKFNGLNFDQLCWTHAAWLREKLRDEGHESEIYVWGANGRWHVYVVTEEFILDAYPEGIPIDDYNEIKPLIKGEVLLLYRTDAVKYPPAYMDGVPVKGTEWDEGIENLARRLREAYYPALRKDKEKTAPGKETEDLIGKSHLAGMAIFRSVQRLLTETEMTGREYPVDVVIDLSMISESDIESSAETWAYLILMCNELGNVNFRFETPDGLTGAGDMIRAIKEKVKAKSIFYSNVNIENLISRVNPGKRGNAIEILLWPKSRIDRMYAERRSGKVENALKDDQYPVALDDTAGLGKGEADLMNFEAALTIGLSLASIAITKKRGDSEELRDKLVEDLLKLYKVICKDKPITRKTILNMVYTDGNSETDETEVKLYLAIKLAIPPIAKMPVQQLRRYHEIIHRYLQAA